MRAEDLQRFHDEIDAMDRSKVYESGLVWDELPPGGVMFLDEFNRANEETLAWSMYLIAGVKPPLKKRIFWHLRHRWRECLKPRLSMFWRNFR
jgi:hypothetical protein